MIIDGMWDLSEGNGWIWVWLDGHGWELFVVEIFYFWNFFLKQTACGLPDYHIYNSGRYQDLIISIRSVGLIGHP